MIELYWIDTANQGSPLIHDLTFSFYSKHMAMTHEIYINKNTAGPPNKVIEMD